MQKHYDTVSVPDDGSPVTITMSGNDFPAGRYEVCIFPTAIAFVPNCNSFNHAQDVPD